MFKNLIWWLLGIALILFAPVIPYEKQTTYGVVEVGNKSIGDFLYDRYIMVQNRNK
jgi:hypothetical protein